MSKINKYCPVCNSEVDDGILNCQKILLTFETDKYGIVKQYWHRSCFIGDNQIDALADKVNSFLASVEDYGEVVKEFCKKSAKTECNELLMKYEDLVDEMDEIKWEVIKYLI